MQHKPPQRLEPWNGERTRHTNPDAYFAPPGRTKSGYAMDSTASKLGSILVLLAISSVAAVGMFMPEEDQSSSLSPKVTISASTGRVDRSTNNSAPQTANVPRDALQQAYAVGYELARQRVKTVGGLTRQQRLDAGREAIAQVLGADVSQLNTAATATFARQAPEPIKKAAFRGVNKGEAMGISEQSQLLVGRMLNSEKRP